MPGSSPTRSSNNTRERIVRAAIDTAKAAAGMPYTPGGKTISGFDCSGYVAYVYQQVLPGYVYMDTGMIRQSGRFTEVKTPLAGDLIYFPKGTNPYEVKKANKREFPDHVGIVLNSNTWIGSQSSTGVAEVNFNNPWWGARTRLFLRFNGLPA